jgi:hypothetical protein
MALADEPDANDKLQPDAETIRSLVSWAWGSLTPQPLARFNLYEVPVGNDCTISLLNHVFILRFGPGLESRADTPLESVIEAITGAYALLEGVAFECTFLGGMDLEHGQWEVIRYFKWLGRHDDDLPEQDAPSSLAMLRAVRVAEAARTVPGYRLALRDVRAAMREREDDAFVFAHRAVSDIARAMSHSGRVDWRALHRHLSTTEDAFRERLGPLQDARDAAAHGDDTDPALILARRNHDGLVKLARQIVVSAMIVDDRIPLDRGVEPPR